MARTESSGESAGAGPVLAEAVMHLHLPASAATAVVVENRLCTKGPKATGFVRHVVLDVSNSKLPGNFIAGQSFGVLPPGETTLGQPHKLRLYSISSASFGEGGNPNHLATTVKRLLDEHHETKKLFVGVASNYLCDLSPGDTVRVTGPSGKRFVLPADPSAHDYVFVATGTGIAPFRGMLHELLSHPTRRAHGSKVALVMGVPYAPDLLYHDELMALAASHPEFLYVPVLSRQAQVDGSSLGPMYVDARLSSHPGLQEILRAPRTLVYVCGIAGMELGVLRSLATSLPDEAAAQYVFVDATAGSPGTWTRAMVHKAVKPTRRVFLEVY
ncbi:MAG: hypothetical protein IPK69_02795 [Phycisphaerales bacterium]|nr:MAG: hypothetical protein IPK69_02795 [Phycisphaerales bacterium]